MSDRLLLAQESSTTTTNVDDISGVYCTDDQLKHGQCRFNINRPLQIKEENPDPTPSNLVEDLVLGATFFIGSLVTIGLIISAIKLIYGSLTGENVSSYKQNVTNAIIGLILVVGAYVIVRIIQYLVRT